MKFLIAGNWKMNGTLTSARALTEDLATALSNNRSVLDKCDMLVCPPFIHLTMVQKVINHTNAPLSLGAQDCALTKNGAYTGDISAEMVTDFGCSHVILGHSERREYHGESDEIVAQKAALAHEQGLVAIICVGEKWAEREAVAEKDVVGGQLMSSIPQSANAQNTVIAYEPVWAIGTGKVATPGDVAAMHDFIREKLKEKLADSAQMRILYGGSMKPDNAADLLAVENVNGGLIGGASLKAEDFVAIAAAAA